MNQKNRITDAAGRQWNTPKEKIELVADIMNSQSIHPLQTSDELFHIFDAALTTEEIEFLGKMGGGSHSLESLKKAVSLPENDFNNILESLIYKGPVAIITNNDNEKVYHIMTIYPGWFEFYMMRGIEDENHRTFAQRIEKMYTAAYEFGNEEVINELISDVGPHLAVTPTNNYKKTSININETVDSETHVYAAPGVLALFEGLDENEFISAGNCLCRFEKELINDHCRANMPLETCISIGPAAEYLIDQGIALQLTKEEAVQRIKEWQNRGCIHQTGRTIPLKDFKTKYPVDIICNCCWDCCGVIGNYNRGYLPLTVTSYYRAEIIADACTGCQTCVPFCPLGIIEMSDDNVAKISESMCIGCGQCDHHCPENAVMLHEDKRVVFLPMLGRDKARITPPDEIMAIENDDTRDPEKIPPSTRDEVLSVLKDTMEKFTRDDIHKTFKKWNKTMLYEFTDLGEFWHYTLENGVPGSLHQGNVEKPDIHYILTGSVFVGLMKGNIDGFKAFRKKLVQVKAPVRDLIKLQKLIG